MHQMSHPLGGKYSIRTDVRQLLATLQPYSISFWIRSSDDRPESSRSTEEIVVADDDPLLTYVLHHPGSLEIDRLHLNSPTLQKLSLSAAEILLPLASQGELLGMLILGPHLKGAPCSIHSHPRSHQRFMLHRWSKRNRHRCANTSASSRSCERL